MSRASPLPLHRKTALAASVWTGYLQVRRRLPGGDLNELVAWSASQADPPLDPLPPKSLGRIVDRLLPFRLSRATCLARSLVLFRLLLRQGLHPELVVGLPVRGQGHEAHAWVEVDGADVGPPPGGRHHRPLARYPTPDEGASEGTARRPGTDPGAPPGRGAGGPARPGMR